MKKIFIPLFFIANMAVAQPQDVQQLIETARTFQRQADYDNALLVLNRAIQQDPANASIIKELAFTYYLQGENNKALIEIKKIVETEDADEQVFQIAGSIYKGLQDIKEGEKVYKKGLKKYPNSGALYSEYGELLYAKDPSADACIKAWEKGIETDANFSGNYYNACRYYGTTGNNLWCILYGELFANLESYTTRTVEIKNILFDIYKQWFIAASTSQASAFGQQVAATLTKQNKEAAYGITPETLTAIRTLFILDWYHDTPTVRPAFRLFEYQRQLLQDGLFEAYNQWLFGSVANTSAYQNWISTHAEANAAFVQFQRGRIFKVPAGQYYGGK